MNFFFKAKKIFQTVIDYLKKESLNRNLTILEEIKKTGRYI